MNQQLNELADNEPLFNIGAVSRMTDIPEATLRIWERRYDFPMPARTTGRHRLYSQQEVQRLQWVKQRVDEGMQISLAVRTLQHMARGGGANLPAPPSPQPIAPEEDQGTAVAVFRRRLVGALLAHDTDQADQVIAEAFVLFPLEALILDVMGPTLHAIGEAWSEGRIDVATEHFATNYLRHHLLTWLRSGPPAYDVSPVVLACAPGELHEGSLLMLAVLLQRRRWPVIYLGQTMPMGELAAFVAATAAAAIVFVAMTEETARPLADWPRWLPAVAQTGHPAVCFGGRAFQLRPELAQRVPGVWLGATLHEGMAQLDQILEEINR